MLMSQKGNTLVTVIVAAALVIGLALVVSTYVTDSVKLTAQVGTAAACNQRLSSVLNQIKSRDNNFYPAYKYMPTSSQLDQRNLSIPYVSDGRTAIPIFGNIGSLPVFNNPANALVDASATGPWNIGVSGGRLNSQSAAEVGMANRTHLWQLKDNSSVLMAILYNQNPNAYCNDFVDVSNTSIFTNILAGSGRALLNENIAVQIAPQNIGGQTNCDALPWYPIPINSNVNAPVTAIKNYKINLRLSYADQNGEMKFCEAESTIGPGEDAEPAVPSIRLSSATPFSVSSSNLLCDSTSLDLQISLASSNSAVARRDAVFFACRVDYDGRGVYPNTKTGWYPCTLFPNFRVNPDSPLVGLNYTGSALFGTDFVNSFHLNFRSLAEGGYTLYVKTIDSARNEAAASFSFLVDLTRPTAVQVLPPAEEIRLFNTPPSSNGFNYLDSTVNPWVRNVSFSDQHFQCAGSNSLLFTCLGSEEMPVSTLNTEWFLDNVPTANPMTMQANGPHTARCELVDECMGVAIRGEFSWTADLPIGANGNPPSWFPSPQSFSNTVLSRPGSLTLNLNTTGTKSDALPFRYVCEQYNNSGSGNNYYVSEDGSCQQNNGGTGFTNSCYANNICNLAVDACGRWDTSTPQTYYVRGHATATTNDNCQQVECAPGYVCGKISGTFGYCYRQQDIVWTNTQNWGGCLPGRSDCSCWNNDSHCSNNMMPGRCNGGGGNCRMTLCGATSVGEACSFTDSNTGETINGRVRFDWVSQICQTAPGPGDRERLLDPGCLGSTQCVSNDDPSVTYSLCVNKTSMTPCTYFFGTCESPNNLPSGGSQDQCPNLANLCPTVAPPPPVPSCDLGVAGNYCSGTNYANSVGDLVCSGTANCACATNTEEFRTLVACVAEYPLSSCLAKDPNAATSGDDSRCAVSCKHNEIQYADETSCNAQHGTANCRRSATANTSGAAVVYCGSACGPSSCDSTATDIDTQCGSSLPGVCTGVGTGSSISYCRNACAPHQQEYAGSLAECTAEGYNCEAVNLFGSGGTSCNTRVCYSGMSCSSSEWLHLTEPNVGNCTRNTDNGQEYWCCSHSCADGSRNTNAAACEARGGGITCEQDPFGVGQNVSGESLYCPPDPCPANEVAYADLSSCQANHQAAGCRAAGSIYCGSGCPSSKARGPYLSESLCSDNASNCSQFVWGNTTVFCGETSLDGCWGGRQTITEALGSCHCPDTLPTVGSACDISSSNSNQCCLLQNGNHVSTELSCRDKNTPSNCGLEVITAPGCPQNYQSFANLSDCNPAEFECQTIGVAPNVSYCGRAWTFRWELEQGCQAGQCGVGQEPELVIGECNSSNLGAEFQCACGNGDAESYKCQRN